MSLTASEFASPRHAMPAHDREAASLAAFVEEFFRRLTTAGIPYCLLRNRDLIPEGLLAWTDLDVLIPRSVSRRKVIAALAALGPINISPRTSDNTALFFRVGQHVLRVDLRHGDVEWRGATFGLNSEILAHRWNDDGVFVASDLDSALVVWFEKLLRNGRFVSRYEPTITKAYLTQPEGFRRRLELLVGRSLADQLVDLTACGTLPRSVELASACRRALWINALKRHPARTLGRYIIQIGDAVAHRLHPQGLDVALLGPDGVGKSSVCHAISELPSRRIPFGDATYERLYHRVLPTLGQIQSATLRHDKRIKRDPSHPQDMRPLHPLVWLGDYGYYTFDHWLSELLWNRKKLAHMMLVLHDRHPMEVVIDPLRYRYAGPAFLPRLIAWLAPRPGLVIVLDAPTDVIQSRKQELSTGEIERQRIAYTSLARSMRNGRIVDASQPFDAVIDGVLREIAAFSRQRTHHRYGALLAQGA